VWETGFGQAPETNPDLNLVGAFTAVLSQKQL